MNNTAEQFEALNKGEFTLSESQIMLMSSYLSHCHQNKTMSDDQYQFYLNQLWTHDNSFENNMKDLNLWEGFSKYQNEQNQINIENQRLLKEQKECLHDTIQKSQAKIQEHQIKANDIQNQLDQPNSLLENAKKRHQQFPENPRLKEEYDKQKSQYDGLNSQLLHHQIQIDQLKAEISLWTTELETMT